tara:strand:+ start:258 stop:728 length:471 start_codon:yes stop_codon:yes gene_type:complete
MNQVAKIEESTYDYSIVTVDQLILIWDGIKKMLEKSCKRSSGRITVDDIFYDALNERKKIWIIFENDQFNIKGVLVTEFYEYPTGKRMLSLEHVAGEKMDEWVELGIDALEQYAKNNQCNGIESIGRAGFWNWVKDRPNWKKLAIFLQYEVDNEKI